MDKVGFNPPETASYKYRGIGLHWDVSLELPIPFGLQGILYLTDTAETQGAFTCVPGFHLQIEQWLKLLPQNIDPRSEDLHRLGSKPIAANAGDCIIWHHALPHGASPNRHHLPRFVQYLNYRPIDYKFQAAWK
jgi:ectoine hydroxylase-related dioxygenase (phytanoyl-CoA dioxygenase family)